MITNHLSKRKKQNKKLYFNFDTFSNMVYVFFKIAMANWHYNSKENLLSMVLNVRLNNYLSINVLFSIDKVPKITSPVLVIHGTEDEVIDFSHGLAIFERCPRTVEPLWVEGAGHNDVELYAQYLERLKQFITVDLAVN